ncbi:universal stress protein [Leifsonia xyli]|uniref:universal stress protein n=1 Tax=Leifsonia xyli TaxID=1575 RepID=UPI003D669801
MGVIGSQLIDEVDDGAQRRLDDELAYAHSLAGHVPVTGELLRGSPMTALAAFSDTDVMLVVGTHKTGFHYGRAFGSRSLQLANLAVGPVAVVPESESRLRRGVVVGVDDSPAGYAALDLAADLACDHQCELVAVRSSSTAVLLDIGRHEDEPDWQSKRDDQARTLLASAAARARQRQPGITIRSRVVRRPPGTALNEVARGAELLVIGDSRKEQPQLGGLGGVAYDVLLNLSSPTIVVHAPQASVTVPPHAKGESHAIG